MKRKRFTEEQIIGVLKEAEVGAKTADLARRHGVITVALYSIDGLDSKAIELELRNTHHVHVKHRTVRHLDGLRVSPHVYTLEDDLARFMKALRQVVTVHR